MANELAVQDFGITSQLGTIKINNYDELLTGLREQLTKYKDYVVTEETLKDDKKLKADLNKLVKQINDKKIMAKREYMEPVTDFESKTKTLIDAVQEVIDPIKAGIEIFDEKSKEQRKQLALSIIAESAPNYDIDPSDVPFVEKWTNKISKSELTKLITDDLAQMQKEKQILLANQELIKANCEMVGENPDAWIPQYSVDQPINDFIARIKKSAENRKLREEQEAEVIRKQEEARKAIEETKVTQTTSGEKVDVETGEIVEPAKETVSFKITGTHEQLDNLADFIANADLECLVLSDRKKVGAK